MHQISEWNPLFWLYQWSSKNKLIDLPIPEQTSFCSFFWRAVLVPPLLLIWYMAALTLASLYIIGLWPIFLTLLTASYIKDKSSKSWRLLRFLTLALTGLLFFDYWRQFIKTMAEDSQFLTLIIGAFTVAIVLMLIAFASGCLSMIFNLEIISPPLGYVVGASLSELEQMSIRDQKIARQDGQLGFFGSMGLLLQGLKGKFCPIVKLPVYADQPAENDN